MSSERTYRNRVNGEIGVYPVDVASAFPNLEEVEDGAKPLAYAPLDTPDAAEETEEVEVGVNPFLPDASDRKPDASDHKTGASNHKTAARKGR